MRENITIAILVAIILGAILAPLMKKLYYQKKAAKANKKKK